LLLSEQPECAPAIVLSEAPYAELPDQGLVSCPLYYAGSLAALGAAGGEVDAASPRS
jgi:hypothetical protein